MSAHAASHITDKIRVCSRFRPPNARELSWESKVATPGTEGTFGAVRCGSDHPGIVFLDTGSETHQFQFDTAFPSSSRQYSVFSNAVLPLVDGIFEGMNTAIIAYGQTGSGKTFTMFGPGFDDPAAASSGRKWICHPDDYGLIPRIIDELFMRIQSASSRYECEVRCSFVQLYNERASDLLTGLKLRVRENVLLGSYVTTATQRRVFDTEGVLALIQEGLLRRTTRSTNANAQSSRSHAILTCEFIKRDPDSGRLTQSHLHLADLAGSERVAHTGATGHVLKEAGHINRSLFALSKVVEALSDPKYSGIIPYRDSLLTKLLKNALGGNSQALMMICCSEHRLQVSETLASLKFGARARRVQNIPVPNIRVTASDLLQSIRRAREKMDAQRREIRRKGRLVADQRKLVQQIMSKLAPTHPLHERLLRALPILTNLPRVWQWGDIYVPEAVIARILRFGGLDALAPGCFVCKRWWLLLQRNTWDLHVWKRALSDEFPDDPNISAPAGGSAPTCWRLYSMERVVQRRNELAAARRRAREEQLKKGGNGGWREGGIVLLP